MRPPSLLPFTWPRGSRTFASPRLTQRAVLAACVALSVTGGCSLILGIQDVTERKSAGGGGGIGGGSASSSGGLGGQGHGGTSSASSSGSPSSSSGPACDPATRWPAVVSDTIVPPNHLMGLDLAGTDDAGLTITEAVAQNCVGADAGGQYASGGGMSWGDAGQANLYYDISTGRWELATVTAGYTGTMTWKSADSTHTYVAAIGKPITKDGQPFVIDWFPTGDGGSVAALQQAEGTELYNAITATFAPGTPVSANCQADQTCHVLSDDGSPQHNAVFIVRGVVHLGIQFPNPTAMPQTTTPNLIYEFAEPSWNDFTQSQRWTTFDASQVDAEAKGFIGVESDGQYLYLVPNGAGSKVTRYDTTQPNGFATAGSAWATYDLVANVDPGATAYSGGTFDYEYVYLAPSSNGLVVRYDSESTFSLAASWQKFDTTKLTPPATSFAGASYGTGTGAVIFVPSTNGVVAAYDGFGVFSDAASWASYDLTTIDPKLTQFHGAVNVGQYTFLAPHGTGPVYPGIVARFDGGAGVITDAAAWQTFSLDSVDPSYSGLHAYDGAVYDGTRYVYFVPADNGGTSGGAVMRYDTTLPFNVVSSWEAYNQFPAKFTTGGWDGRYVYFSGANKNIIRYDSTLPFKTQSSWSYFDVADGVNTSASAFQGTAFDGRFMYFVPDTYSTLARLDSKFPPIGVNAIYATYY